MVKRAIVRLNWGCVTNAMRDVVKALAVQREPRVLGPETQNYPLYAFVAILVHAPLELRARPVSEF